MKNYVKQDMNGLEIINSPSVVNKLTQAQYDALPSAQKEANVYVATGSDNNKLYAYGKEITGGTGAVTAEITLLASNWTDNTQTVEVNGVKAGDSQVIIINALTNDYVIRCTGNTLNSLTFSCDSTPSTNIDVEVAIFENGGGNTKVNNPFEPEFKDITAYFDNGYAADVANGDFSKLKLGNYIKKTVSGVSNPLVFMYASPDYFYGGYNSYATVAAHHGAFIVFGLPPAAMNSSDTTSGGYTGSAMNTLLKGTYLTYMQNAVGSSRMLAHQCLLSNKVDGWAWQDNTKAVLMSEMQIYGGRPMSNAWCDTGEANRQLDLFKGSKSFMEILQKGTELAQMASDNQFKSKHCWLRDIAAHSPSASFCCAYAFGLAGYYGASGVVSVVPLVLLT